MTEIESTSIRELSPKEIDGVSGGGSVLGASAGAAGDEYGAAPSGAESLQNTFVAKRPVSPSLSGATLFHL